MTKKSKAKAKEAKPEGSKIIEQCVIYVQCLAAYDAGFSVHRTGDADFCNTGDQIKKAHRAMCKLVGLSPNKTHGTAAITPLDLYAKARVLETMYGLRKDEEPNEIEMAYIPLFSGEVQDFLIAKHQVGE
jgi:hypothetical protein